MREIRPLSNKSGESIPSPYSWTRSEESALRKMRDSIVAERLVHNVGAKYKKTIYYVISISIFLLTGVVTLINTSVPFCAKEGPLDCDDVQWAVFTVGILAGVSTLFGAINTFLNYGRKYTDHHKAEGFLALLQSEIERIMYQKPTERGSWTLISHWIISLHNGISLTSPHISIVTRNKPDFHWPVYEGGCSDSGVSGSDEEA